MADIDSSICWSSIGSGMAARMRDAVFMRIMVIECPRACKAGKYLGSKNPGVDRNLLIRINSSKAFIAYSFSPDAMAYSDIAIAAKHSENT